MPMRPCRTGENLQLHSTQRVGVTKRCLDDPFSQVVKNGDKQQWKWKHNDDGTRWRDEKREYLCVLSGSRIQRLWSGLWYRRWTNLKFRCNSCAESSNECCQQCNMRLFWHWQTCEWLFDEDRCKEQCSRYSMHSWFWSGCGTKTRSAPKISAISFCMYQLYRVLIMKQAAGTMMTKFGLCQNLSIGQGILSTAMKSARSMKDQSSPLNSVGSLMQFGGAANSPIHGLMGDKNLSKGLSYENIQTQGLLANSSHGNQTGKLMSKFHEAPAPQEHTQPNKTYGGHLQAEDRMRQMH